MSRILTVLSWNKLLAKSDLKNIEQIKQTALSDFAVRYGPLRDRLFGNMQDALLSQV